MRSVCLHDSTVSQNVNSFHPCFWTHLGLKYTRLTKFIPKLDPRIFMDSLDKSAFYKYVISRNKLAQIGKVYSIGLVVHYQLVEETTC